MKSKKIISMVLALAMVFSVSVEFLIYADENNSYKIKSNNGDDGSNQNRVGSVKDNKINKFLDRRNKDHTNYLTIKLEKDTNLSSYEQPVLIEGKTNLRIFAKKYGVIDSDIEKIIYKPITDQNKKIDDTKSNYETREFGNDELYYKNIEYKGETKGEKIHTAYIDAPGGECSISKSIMTNVSMNFSSGVEVGTDEIRASFGVQIEKDLTKSLEIQDTQFVDDVLYGYHKRVRAYVIYDVYNAEVWEKDKFFDDYYGKVTIKIPTGVIFEVSNNIKKH